jgi:hypothetical protein
MGDVIPFRKRKPPMMDGIVEENPFLDQESELSHFFHEFVDGFKERGFNLHSITVSSDNFGYDDDGDFK